MYIVAQIKTENMSNKLIQNYAQALFENAVAGRAQEQALEQINLINQVISKDEEIYKFINSPVTPYKDKTNLIDILVKKIKAIPIVERFLRLLILNSHSHNLIKIVQAYENLLKQSKDIKTVSILSSAPLPDEEKNYFQTYLEKKLNKKLDIIFNLDKSLIKGVVIQYDSIVMDYSALGALERIKKTIKDAKVFEE